MALKDRINAVGGPASSAIRSVGLGRPRVSLGTASLLGVAVATVSGGAMPACAQQVSPASAPSDAKPAPEAAAPNGEIIVTAQRREESLQRVPIALSAVTAVQAERLNIRTVQDLQLVTPGLSYKSPYTYAQIYIRGVGTPFANPGLETSVAVYTDGVYLQRQLGTVFDLVDPATTQVLKGPQGTLYGRNASGGVILLNTADPVDKPEGRVSAEYGNFNRVQGDVMLNEPVTDNLTLRIAGRIKNDDGYIQNDFDGKMLGGGKTYLMRGKLAWAPSDNVQELLTVEYLHDKADSAALALRVGAPLCLVCAIIPGNGPVQGAYHTDQDVDSPATTKSLLASLRTRVKTGDYDVQGTLAYRRLTWRGANEVDLSPVNFFRFDSVIAGSTYTGDFQISSRYSGPFNFITGVSLLKDDGLFDAGLRA